MKSKNIKIYNFTIFSSKDITAGVTTKLGGYSKGAYSGLNLATHTEDDVTDVTKNRKLLCTLTNTKYENYVYSNQVHQETIITIDNSNKNIIHNSDGLVTTEKEILLNIYIADCVPIIVFDPILKVLSVIHCGWKGTYLKLLEKTILLLKKKYNSNTKNIIIGIGPSIGECCYNVSKDLFYKFAPKENEGYIKNNKYYLNLKKINKNQALTMGIIEENIETINHCTYCNKDFYSHRREGEPTGRFSLFAKINR